MLLQISRISVMKSLGQSRNLSFQQNKLKVNSCHLWFQLKKSFQKFKQMKISGYINIYNTSDRFLVVFYILVFYMFSFAVIKNARCKRLNFTFQMKVAIISFDFKIISSSMKIKSQTCWFVFRTVEMLKRCVRNCWIYLKYSWICLLRRKSIVLIGIDKLQCVLAFDENLLLPELSSIQFVVIKFC